MHRIGAFLLVFMCFRATAILVGQERAQELGPLVLKTPAVRAAVDFARTSELQTILDQVRL